MRLDLEHREQANVIRWWALAHRGFGLPEFSLFCIPTGGLRSKATAGKLYAEGVRRGIYDLELPVASGSYHGLRVEMKSELGRPTPQQKIFGAWCDSEGWKTMVCYNSGEAIDAIKAYLEPRMLAVSRRSTGTQPQPALSS